jgi:hypothetical protein
VHPLRFKDLKVFKVIKDYKVFKESRGLKVSKVSMVDLKVSKELGVIRGRKETKVLMV